MRRLVLALSLLWFAANTYGDIVNGVTTPGPVVTPVPVPSPTAVTPPPPGAIVINFDDRGAPCLFLQTVPLTSAYSATGVTFQGPAPNSGGAILNQCGTFSVSGYSSPNFLAFNRISFLQTGEAPIPPETITFSYPVDLVQINAGHSDAGTVTLQCFTNNALVGSTSISGTSSLTTMSVQGQGIRRCTLNFDGGVLVVDDLAFVLPPSALPIGWWALLALAGVLAVCGAARLRM